MEIKRKAFVYVGPDRPFGLPIMRNTILAGEPEDVFPDAWTPLREHRNFRKLFVPVSELAGARAALKKPGTPLYLFSQEIKKASDDFKAARAGK